MAIKQLGTQFRVGLTPLVTIEGVAIVNSQTISEGYLSITETQGMSGDTENVTMANYGIDISVSGTVAAAANNTASPKNGDTCTIEGYEIAWIDGVSTAETSGAPAAFSCTAHGRKKAEQTTAA